MSIIERGTYLAKVEKFIEKDLIKVFIGQRCVCKSYLLKATINHILNKLPHANIIYITVSSQSIFRWFCPLHHL